MASNQSLEDSGVCFLIGEKLLSLGSLSAFYTPNPAHHAHLIPDFGNKPLPQIKLYLNTTPSLTSF